VLHELAQVLRLGRPTQRDADRRQARGGPKQRTGVAARRDDARRDAGAGRAGDRVRRPKRARDSVPGITTCSLPRR
jgi:hypothetical protein